MNIKRLGLSPIVLLTGYLLFVILWYFVLSVGTKFDLIISPLLKLFFSGSFSAIIGILVLYFRFRPEAIKLIKKYSKQKTFKQYLGIQAEIQKEFKFLLTTWIKDSRDKKILLFVDDIDRCHEERIIQIIDSLRVMLDEDEIYQRVIIISALDERVLKRAIEWKYSYFNNKMPNNEMLKQNSSRRSN